VDATAVGFYERCGFTREDPDAQAATAVMTKDLD
jgi:hypothetical protein